MMSTAVMAQIERETAEVDFGQGSRRVVAAVLYYPARLVGSLVAGLVWCVAAWRVGYRDGRGRRSPMAPAVAALVPDRTTR